MSEPQLPLPPGAPDDRELEDFLARRSEVSRAYREAVPTEVVPADIDAAVKAWAQREHAQHEGVASRWLRHAGLPLAAAASLMLVAILVWRGREAGVSERSAMQAATATATAREVPAAPNSSVPPLEDQAVAENLPAAAASDSVSERKAQTAAAQPRPFPAAPKSAAKPGATMQQAAPPQQLVSSAPEAAPAPAPSPPEAAAAGGLQATVSELPPQSTAQPAAAERAEAEAEKANSMPEAKASASRIAGAAATSSSAAPAAEPSPPMPAAPAPAMGARAPMAAAPDTGRPQFADGQQLQRCEEAQPQAVLDAALFSPPDAWLGGIRMLRDRGHTDAAQRQLRCWQRVYPQLPLPTDLQALMPAP